VFDRAADGDRQDVEASRAGDEEAFARLVRRYQAGIAVQMRHFSRDPQVLDELTAEVFVSAYRGLHGFKGAAPFAHWLRRIATRVGYGYWRREARERSRRETLAQLALELPRSNEAEDPGAAAEFLHTALARLAPQDRLVLTLQYFEDCDMKEIAERTGWNAGLVKVRAFRARKRLKKILDEAGFGRND